MWQDNLHFISTGPQLTNSSRLPNYFEILYTYSIFFIWGKLFINVYFVSYKSKKKRKKEKKKVESAVMEKIFVPVKPNCLSLLLLLLFFFSCFFLPFLFLFSFASYTGLFYIQKRKRINRITIEICLRQFTSLMSSTIFKSLYYSKFFKRYLFFWGIFFIIPSKTITLPIN